MPFIGYVYIYMYIHIHGFIIVAIHIIYIWVNYNDLTATSLESWLVREIIPKCWVYRLAIYNLRKKTKKTEELGSEPCLVLFNIRRIRGMLRN